MTPMDRMMRNRIVVESAGTENFPHVVKPMLSDYPRSRELDVYTHRRHRLTPAVLDADLVVAMSTEHEIRNYYFEPKHLNGYKASARNTAMGYLERKVNVPGGMASYLRIERKFTESLT